MAEPQTPDPGRPELIVFGGDDDVVLVGEVIDAVDAVIPDSGGSGPNIPPIAFGQILETVPDVARALKGGAIMRVVSRPAGPLWKVDGGVLGTVRDEKGIVGHVRFAGDPENARVVAAPAAAFQIASAVTLQYYLNTITKQLESLQRGIGDIKEWLAADADAELEGAEQSCCDVARHLAASRPLREADLVKLNDAHNVGRRRFAAARMLLESLEARVDEAITEGGDVSNRGKLKEALKDGATAGVANYQRLMRAAVLTIRALALIATHDAKADPNRLETTQDAALREIEEMRSALVRLSSMLNKLNIRTSAIERDAGWTPNKWGKLPHDELEDYRVATKDLRRILRQAPDRLLPTLVASSPWVMEARMRADGSVETRVHELEIARPGSST
jgi:hypothetical protein